MNRKIEEFLTGKGLSVTGDKAYGTVNGYEVNVIITVQFSMEINVYFTCKADQTLIDDLKALLHAYRQGIILERPEEKEV